MHVSPQARPGGRLTSYDPRPRNKKIVHPLHLYQLRWRGAEHRIINFWPIRLRFEIVRGAQEPSQRRDMKGLCISTSTPTSSIGCLPQLQWQERAAVSTPLVYDARVHGPAQQPPSLFFPPARPTSGFYVKLCRPVPPVFRLFVSVSEGTGAKEVITARSP